MSTNNSNLENSSDLLESSEARSNLSMRREPSSHRPPGFHNPGFYKLDDENLFKADLKRWLANDEAIANAILRVPPVKLPPKFEIERMFNALMDFYNNSVKPHQYITKVGDGYGFDFHKIFVDYCNWRHGK